MVVTSGSFDQMTLSSTGSARYSTPDSINEDNEQGETRQPSPAALFSEVAVGSDAGLGSTLAPAGDGACSGRSAKMKHYRIAVCLVILMLSQPASAVGFADIWYPVSLPYNQVDEEEIEVKKLPFATRFSYPEFIGAALSAPYPVPNNDSSPLPKDINVISANGIDVSTNEIPTNVADSGREGKRISVELVVDLRKYARPSYPSPPDSTVMTAVAEAVLRSLAFYDCQVADTKIHATAEQVELKKALVLALQTEIAEQNGTGQPATRPESKSEGGDKPQPEAEGRSR